MSQEMEQRASPALDPQSGVGGLQGPQKGTPDLGKPLYSECRFLGVRMLAMVRHGKGNYSSSPVDPLCQEHFMQIYIYIVYMCVCLFMLQIVVKTGHPVVFRDLWGYVVCKVQEYIPQQRRIKWKSTCDHRDI